MTAAGFATMLGSCIEGGETMTNDELDLQIKRLIVETLMLEEVTAEDIDTKAPLFVEGLGLDSIDALELALAIHKRFGVRTRADDERNREYFYSVETLREFIKSRQAAPAGATGRAGETGQTAS
jgi:acyl carrier protein